MTITASSLMWNQPEITRDDFYKNIKGALNRDYEARDPKIDRISLHPNMAGLIFLVVAVVSFFFTSAVFDTFTIAAAISVPLGLAGIGSFVVGCLQRKDYLDQKIDLHEAEKILADVKKLLENQILSNANSEEWVLDATLNLSKLA